MVQKYFQDKATAAAKAEKEEEQRLRKVASFVAKEIRLFWSQVEKVGGGYLILFLWSRLQFFFLFSLARRVQTANTVGGEAQDGSGSAFELHCERD